MPPANLVVNPFEPVFDQNSKILILGTMPSPKSRSLGFYYSHPMNRFWPVLSVILAKEIPPTPESKREFLIQNGIAMWDVLSSCEIENADDASIKSPVVNDFSVVFDAALIRAVFTTGKKAFALYKKHCMSDKNRLESFYLPSTSPANQGNYSFDDLVSSYKIILEYL